MQIRNSTQTSTLDRVLGISLAAFSMFVVGYTASRVLLIQSTSQNTPLESTVTPHQSSMWSALGK